MENPLNAPYPEVKKCFANHTDISSKEKAAFYAEMVNSAVAGGEEAYLQAVDRVSDKDLLEGPK